MSALARLKKLKSITKVQPSTLTHSRQGTAKSPVVEGSQDMSSLTEASVVVATKELGVDQKQLRQPQTSSSQEVSSLMETSSQQDTPWLVRVPTKGEFGCGELVTDAHGRELIIEANLSTQYACISHDGKRTYFYHKADKNALRRTK